MRLGIDKAVPREEWNKYSCTSKFIVGKQLGTYGIGDFQEQKTFYSLDDAEFYLQHLRSVEDKRNLGIKERLEIIAERIL